MSRVRRQPQARISDREEHQPDAEHRSAWNPVGQQPGRIARHRIHRVVRDVRQDHLDHREADLVEPQQQQGVREVHHGEGDQHRAHPPVAAGQLADPGEHCLAADARHRHPSLTNKEHQRDRQDRRHDRHPQQRRDLMIEQLVSGQTEERADDGAERVHRPVEPENAAARGVVDIDDEQRVAWRTANSLAEPVDNPAGQHPRPAGGRGHHDLAQCRHAVPGGDQRTAREPVAERSRGQLRQRRRAFRGAFHNTDYRRGRAQHRCQIDRQQRVEQLACGVLEKRDRRQHPDIAGQPAAHLRHHAVQRLPRVFVGDGSIALGACPVDGGANQTEDQTLHRGGDSASRVERVRSFGSGGSWSDGLTRCQTSVKILPASRATGHAGRD